MGKYYEQAIEERKSLNSKYLVLAKGIAMTESYG